MYLLYLDDAGSVQNASDKHYVLAGIALFERQVHFLDKSLNELAQSIDPDLNFGLEFHANHMLTGRGQWRKQGDRQKRRQYIAQVLAAADQLQGRWCLFGAVIEKAAVSPEDASEFAFEQLCNQFDLFLGRLHRTNDTQRGLIILDKSTTETRIQTLANEFRRSGHRWGQMRNIVDVPFFVDSRASRAIQFADMVAYALWRKFEKGDDEFYHVIETAFDAVGGVRHGLFVKTYGNSKQGEQ
jgi:Protein of unknown function (DUF3800)